MANASLTFDRLKSALVDSAGYALSTANQPKLIFSERPTWTLTVKDGSSAVSMSSCVTFAFSIAEDWETGTVAGALTASKSGAVTVITADGFASAPPTSGVIHLTNSNGDTEAVGYSSWTVNSGTYSFAVLDTLDHSYSNDDSCVFEESPPMVRIENADITSTLKASGIVSFSVPTDNNVFLGAVQGKSSWVSCIGQLCGYDSNGYLVIVIQFGVQARGLIDSNIGELPGPASNYYSKAEALALLRAGRDIEYSINGSTSWHATQAEADRYWRERYPDGEWGDAIAMVIGPTGPAAAALQIEYSIDGSTSWHGTWSAGDLYLRTSVNGGTTWGGAVLIVAPDVEFEYSIDGATLWHTPWVDGDLYMRQSTDGGTTWSDEIRIVGPATMFEYSIDGATLWHETFTNSDLYLRISVDGGETWGGAIRLVGPAVMFQYSINGSTLWHDTFTNDDLYLRISIDGGATWGAASLFVASVKGDLSFTNSDLAAGILTVSGVVPIAAIVDNSGKVIEPAEITYATNTAVDLLEYGTISGTWRVRFAQGGTTGPQGIQGETGQTGATGATPDIDIGTVTTGAAGSSASATITGTTPNLTLNLTIPRGDTGAQGPAGADGADGSGAFESRTSDYAAIEANSGKTWMRTDLETPTAKIVMQHQNAGAGWQDSWSQSFAANDSLNSASQRQVITSSQLTKSGTSIRLTLTASTANQLTVNHVSIVEQFSGADGTTTPTEVLFNGSSGFSITAGQTKTSDITVFTLDETKNYLIIIDYAASGYCGFLASGSYTVYYKSASASYNQQTVSGYTAQNQLYALSKIEAYTESTTYTVKTFAFA